MERQILSDAHFYIMSDVTGKTFYRINSTRGAMKWKENKTGMIKLSKTGYLCKTNFHIKYNSHYGYNA